MPRLARKYLESSYCHIIVQGINKELIFQKTIFKDTYKNILKRNLSKTDINLLAYCIMDNHAHLLLHSDKINMLTKLMQRTNTSYAKFYNKVQKRVGFVFRDRYYSQMILSEQQLFNCIAYIHSNPLKARIVENFENYPFSSYKEYIGKKDLITEESIKLLFDNNGIINNPMFAKIHDNTNINDIIDVKDQVMESREIISRYTTKHSKTIAEIIKDENLFCNLLLDLRHNGNLSLREMSKIFNINKDKINKIINKNL